MTSNLLSNDTLGDLLSKATEEEKLYLTKLLNKELNTDISEILLDENEEEEYKIEVGSPYEKVFNKVSILKSYLKEAMDIFTPVSKKQTESVLSAINMVAHKPNLGVMGRSDSGKSHFINALLNNDCLPACWQAQDTVRI